MKDDVMLNSGFYVLNTATQCALTGGDSTNSRRALEGVVGGALKILGGKIGGVVGQAIILIAGSADKLIDGFIDGWNS